MDTWFESVFFGKSAFRIKKQVRKLILVNSVCVNVFVFRFSLFVLVFLFVLVLVLPITTGAIPQAQLQPKTDSARMLFVFSPLFRFQTGPLLSQFARPASASNMQPEPRKAPDNTPCCCPTAQRKLRCGWRAAAALFGRVSI